MLGTALCDGDSGSLLRGSYAKNATLLLLACPSLYILCIHSNQPEIINMTLFKYARPGLFGGRPTLAPLNRLQEEVHRLFDSPLGDFGSQFFNVWAPALDVYEDKDNLVVTLEVPGVKKEAFEIGLHDGVLSIAGERRFEDRKPKATDYRSERF